MLLKRERAQKERIDAPADRMSFEEYRSACRAVEWTNRHLGGELTLIQPLESMVRARRLTSFTVLDVGCGGGDMDEALVVWGRRRRYGIKLIGIDNHAHAVRIAKERVSPHPEIDIVQSDIFEAKFSDGSFDFVVSSLMLHHLSTEQLSFFLWKAYRLARVGVVLTDLRRNYPSYCLARTVVPLLAPTSPIFKNDAALSFRRAYTLNEMRGLLASGGYPYRVKSPWFCPFRIALAAEHPAPQPVRPNSPVQVFESGLRGEDASRRAP